MNLKVKYKKWGVLTTPHFFVILLKKRMENKLNIYVFTHKNFENYPTADCYKLVTMGEEGINVPLETIVCDKNADEFLLKEHAYSEGARIHYIWKNVEQSEYVGTAHYRRYFPFFNDIPDMDEIFNEHDGIISSLDVRTWGFDNVYHQYKSCHYEQDLQLVLNIIMNEFHEYSEAAFDIITNPTLYWCNIFILRREMFDEYCKFVFGVLGRYDEIMGFKTDKDVEGWVDRHLDKYVENKAYEANRNRDYQTRIQAFLMERVSSIFFRKMLKNPLVLELKNTEY